MRKSASGFFEWGTPVEPDPYELMLPACSFTVVLESGGRLHISFVGEESLRLLRGDTEVQRLKLHTMKEQFRAKHPCCTPEHFELWSANLRAAYFN